MAKTIKAADATAEQLRDFAVQVMNLPVKGTWGEPKIREQLKLVGFDTEAEGAMIPLYEKPEPAPASTQNGSIRMMQTSSGREEEHYCIVVAAAEGEGGDKPVVCRVNGVNFLIPRGKKVWVPKRYVEALEHAVRDVYDSTENGLSEPRQVQSYPFSIAAA